MKQTIETAPKPGIVDPEVLAESSPELVIGSEQADAVIDALNSAPGIVARDQYLPKAVDVLSGSVLVAAFTHDSEQAQRHPEGDPERARLYEVPIRVDKVVGAAGFIDFVQGRGKGVTKSAYENGQRTDRTSPQLIKKYARQSSETAPPIKGVVMFTQENGETYAMVFGDGSHRVAAAKLRGDKYVNAYDVSVWALADNRISDSIMTVS